MSDVLEKPIQFEKLVPRVAKKPQRPPLHRISLIWMGPGTYLDGKIKVDEAYAEALSKYFQRSFDKACMTIRKCHVRGVQELMIATPEIAEARVTLAKEYVHNNLRSPFLPAMHFTHERI